jgi:DNA-3-methyladenine glycosylase II
MKNPDYWQDSVNYLTKTDKSLGSIINHYKDYSISSRGEAYETLVRSIVGQQISIQAASSVWNKIVALVKTIEPNKVLLTSRENLKLCGLSKQKIQYIYNIS